MVGGMPFEVKLPKNKTKEVRGTVYPLLGSLHQAKDIPEQFKVRGYATNPNELLEMSFNSKFPKD